MLTRTPSGLDEIIHTFGNIDSQSFETRNIVMFDFPYPLLYNKQPVRRGRCHKLLVENFQAVFSELKAQGLDQYVKNYSGIYERRSIRGYASHASAHSWGIAIDLEAAQYPLGSSARFPDEVVAIFNKHGFFYGGDFKSRKDPMHFQYAINY